MEQFLPELIADNAGEFFAIVSEPARDVARLRRSRSSTRRLKRTPLRDEPGFAKTIEATNRDLWRRLKRFRLPGLVAG